MAYLYNIIDKEIALKKYEKRLVFIVLTFAEHIIFFNKKITRPSAHIFIEANREYMQRAVTSI